MTTRRSLFLRFLILCSAALGTATAAKPAPLTVTYYFLPG